MLSKTAALAKWSCSCTNSQTRRRQTGKWQSKLLSGGAGRFSIPIATPGANLKQLPAALQSLVAPAYETHADAGISCGQRRTFR